MHQWWIISLILLAVLVVAAIVLYILGDRMQKKQAVQREQMNAAAQPVTMLIIDKKRMKMKDANLPKFVMDQTPKRYRNAKIPVVKAKVGPQIMSLMCDEDIFDTLPTRGEVKAMVSGIYIISVKNVRGKVSEAPAEKGIGAKIRGKQKEYRRQLDQENARSKNDKAAKAKAKKSADRASKITDKIK